MSFVKAVVFRQIFTSARRYLIPTQVIPTFAYGLVHPSFFCTETLPLP